MTLILIYRIIGLQDGPIAVDSILTKLAITIDADAGGLGIRELD